MVNPIKALKRFAQRRINARKQRLFEEGYCWAASHLAMNSSEESLQEVYTYTTAAAIMGTYNAYDDGVRAAINAKRAAKRAVQRAVQQAAKDDKPAPEWEVSAR